MDARVLLFLFLLGFCWCCNARVVTTDLFPVQDVTASELQVNHQQHEKRDEGVCTLCEVVLAPIIVDLSNKTTQEELMANLHLICSFTFDLKDKCNAIVDLYVPLIYSEASSLTPEELCIKVGLCYNASHTEASLGLAHADFQRLNSSVFGFFRLVELLLKACNAVEGSVNNCKRLLLANEPLIPVYAKQMLKEYGICNLSQDCSSAANAAEEASNSETSTISAS